MRSLRTNNFSRAIPRPFGAANWVTLARALIAAALLAFVGSGSGFVTKWYDQSGQGNDIAQATASKQPKIVDSGTYLGAVEFDGVDDIAFYSTPACNALTFCTRMQFRTAGTTTDQPIISSTANGSTGQLAYYFQRHDSNGNLDRFVFNGSSQYLVESSNIAFTENVELFAISGTPQVLNVRYVDGSETSDGSGGSGSIAGGAFFASTASIGGSEAGSGWAPVSFKNFVIWAGDMRGSVAQITGLL